MLKKYAILTATIIALTLLVIATHYYPGGSQADKNSIGYSSANNYLSNLFGEKAVNGAPNAARPWAAAGMLMLSVSFAFFFIDFSAKIPQKGAARVVKYCGIGAMVAAFLAVTAYHDSMVMLGSTLSLISMFYIMVFVFKSRLNWFKPVSVVCLLVFYACMYCYYSHSLIGFLPVLQKITIAITIGWMLTLQYFTTKDDLCAGKNLAINVHDE